ncbi:MULTISPECIES: hypothetical protein [unclassified Streptomyces]|uniref:hypothetical protein n=1 Tax=unclassified Streptomyces TaxID=2593676 RepID=UPI001909C483|nr:MULTISPECIES: hypothetical protein [unclassified Streptomyces]MBK3565804.1 hypothetical protein [Streptomyces sp. MBT62]MBK6014337.1 hypothetical protein [Streptomyces sp. MBT53]
MEQLPESVDRDILRHRTVAAIATIRETLGCSIHQAVDVLAKRHEELRRDRPGDFEPSRDQHGG